MKQLFIKIIKDIIRFFNHTFKRKPRNIIIKKKSLSVLGVRQALIDNKIIDDDGYKAKDIVDINSAAIWEKFREIYERNEKANVLYGQFSFYLEEYVFLAQIYEVSPVEFKILIDEFCTQLNCVAFFSKESIEALDGQELNKVTIKHSFFSQKFSEIRKSFGDELSTVSK